MPRPPDTKTAVAVREHDDDQLGHYMRAGTTTQTNDANTEQQSWSRAADIILAARAATGEPFSANDLRRDGLPEPAKPALWGALFRQAQADGSIVSVGVVNSGRASRHGSLMRVWVGAHGEGIAA